MYVGKLRLFIKSGTFCLETFLTIIYQINVDLSNSFADFSQLICGTTEKYNKMAKVHETNEKLNIAASRKNGPRIIDAK